MLQMWKRRWSGSKGAPAVVLALVISFVSAPALAAPISVVLEPFTGSDSLVMASFENGAESGTVEVTVEVILGVADLRGLFFDVALDDSLLDDLIVTGDDVTDFMVGSVINTGGGNNLNGGGSPCPCAVGVEIGTPGIGRDDIMMTSFIISHATEDITLALFFGQDIGARVTSTGVDETHRGGSSKLGGTIPVPEPESALLLSLGMVVLAHRRMRASRA